MSPAKFVLLLMPAVALAAALAVAGCGDFWQPPNATSSTSGGATATSTVLTASQTSATAGGSVTLTATVTPSAATGTVTFYDNSSSIGSESLSSGTATASVTFPTAGTQSLTATYGGDSTYGSSTSSAITVTVSASSSSVLAARPAALKHKATGADAASTTGAPTTVSTTAHEAAPIHATSAFTDTGGAFTAADAEGVEVEDNGSATLTNATITAADGNNRDILLYGSTSSGSASGSATPAFTMTGGALNYACNPASAPACAEGSASAGENHPATLFSIANAKATISLTDVRVTNSTSTPTNGNGTLLTAAALYSGAWGAAGANGGNVTLRALGTSLTGDVIVDSTSTADLSLLADSSGTGSSLTGAINAADSGKAVSLTLDAASVWTVAGTSHLTSLSGLEVSGTTASNIDGGGHCVYYSGTVNGAGPATGSTAVYTLGGSGGYLAPEGTERLACN